MGKVNNKNETLASPLPTSFKPGPHDVICARGSLAANHMGNRWYRQVVEQHFDKYLGARARSEKSFIVASILNTVKTSSQTGGGFVRKMGGRWYIVADEFAREKIGQTFRNMQFTRGKSEKKATQAKRAIEQGKNNTLEAQNLCERTTLDQTLSEDPVAKSGVQRTTESTDSLGVATAAAPASVQANTKERPAAVLAWLDRCVEASDNQMDSCILCGANMDGCLCHPASTCSVDSSNNNNAGSSSAKKSWEMLDEFFHVNPITLPCKKTRLSWEILDEFFASSEDILMVKGAKIEKNFTMSKKAILSMGSLDEFFGSKDDLLTLG